MILEEQIEEEGVMMPIPMLYCEIKVADITNLQMFYMI